MHHTYKEPEYWASSFNCPHCGAFSSQKWGDHILLRASDRGNGINCGLPSLSAAVCDHCKNYSLWITPKNTMIYPFSGTAPLPNPDIPQDIAKDYLEARDIAAISSRGSAALLRLAIQKLCIHLGEDGNDINSAIKSLVTKGIGHDTQKSLDIIRVIGNEAVHPGTLDLRDDPQTVHRLFLLVNIIASDLITKPKMIEEMYSIIPDNKKKGIEQRDSSSKI